jgi:hypothetical protein
MTRNFGLKPRDESQETAVVVSCLTIGIVFGVLILAKWVIG